MTCTETDISACALNGCCFMYPNVSTECNLCYPFLCAQMDTLVFLLVDNSPPILTNVDISVERFSAESLPLPLNGLILRNFFVKCFYRNAKSLQCQCIQYESYRQLTML